MIWKGTVHRALVGGTLSGRHSFPRKDPSQKPQNITVPLPLGHGPGSPASARLHPVHALRSLTLTTPAVSGSGTGEPFTHLLDTSLPKCLAQAWAHHTPGHWEGAGLAECSDPSPTIAGCGIALISGCGGKERVKLAPGPKLQGEHPCCRRYRACWMLLGAWPHPASLRHPACLTDTEKQRKSAGGGSGRGALPPNRLLERHWWLSEEQGFLLEVIPLPQSQAVKLFDAHPKHFLELFR